MKHIDEWLAEPATDVHEAEAKEWLRHYRRPAATQDRAWLDARIVTCTYKGKSYRCIGTSRMGDVWLTADFSRTYGYDLRIDVSDCSAWLVVPAREAKTSSTPYMNPTPDRPEASCTIEHLWQYLNYQYPATVGDLRLKQLCADIVVATASNQQLQAEHTALSEDKAWRLSHSAVTLIKDGDHWCVVGPDFVNLQESNAGFGTTPDEALANYTIDVSGQPPAHDMALVACSNCGVSSAFPQPVSRSKNWVCLSCQHQHDACI